MPPGGSLVKCKYSIGGSGSGFIYGFCDVNYKDNMTLNEAKEFVKKCKLLKIIIIIFKRWLWQWIVIVPPVGLLEWLILLKIK